MMDTDNRWRIALRSIRGELIIIGMIAVSIVLINTPKLLFEDKIHAYEKEQLQLTVELQKTRIDYASLILEHLETHSLTPQLQEFFNLYHGNLCVLDENSPQQCPLSIIDAVQSTTSASDFVASTSVNITFAEGSILFFQVQGKQIRVLWFNHASFWPAPQKNISLVLVRGNHIQFLDNPIAHYNALLNYTILRHRDDYGTLQFENMELSFLRWNLGEYQLISVFNDKVRLFNLIYWVMSASLTLLLTLTWFLTRLNLQKVAAQRHVYIDNLTRLNNRHFLNKISTKFIEHPHSIAAMIDIDHFKKINDQYGHITGDRILQAVASCLRKNVRDGDTIIRFGGEEFLLLFQAHSNKEAWHMLDRLRQRVKDDHSLYGTTISIGFTFIDGSLPAAISRADTALYQAKEAGRNQVVADSEKENDSAADLPIQC
ncbi:GGDEF domain-containing protein [Vibrio cholerae]|nr:GGDEF domain-containing protein [Vibrio cholerae]EGQ9635166.1 GGDEF domain-containing protein [Vibrio cholerae]EGR0030711.1 GGDEF domain-containing protein [Vibrio cholerae]EGR0607590.1 GGDEF domain-containing protein [Vibrio cholerae]EGR1277535.1 GGDEF domain-containing protein [Vibrio cholerae]